MRKSTKQHKNSESHDERSLRKERNRGTETATTDLPGAIQRASNNETGQPSDILALQRTVGNRVVQRIVNKQVKPAALQRHVPPDADAIFQQDFPGVQETYTIFSDRMPLFMDQINSLRRGALASRDYQGGAHEGTSAPTAGAEGTGSAAAGGSIESEGTTTTGS